MHFTTAALLAVAATTAYALEAQELAGGPQKPPPTTLYSPTPIKTVATVVTHDGTSSVAPLPSTAYQGNPGGPAQGGSTVAPISSSGAGYPASNPGGPAQGGSTVAPISSAPAGNGTVYQTTTAAGAGTTGPAVQTSVKVVTGSGAATASASAPLGSTQPGSAGSVRAGAYAAVAVVLGAGAALM